MGRRLAADAVLSGAETSQSLAESSFRELDDVFLQRQTRIWLGEVLKTRLNEEIHISDLLADGELLFEVSKLLWNMLLVKCVELRHLKAHQYPLRSRKSSGRYMPYSNVDSFLKICKVLGLDGIDLFSPSDVVEKRDTRKVCICTRALSKKARSKQLNVPDFDVVSYAIPMPTDMVECIRRSLESSQCSFSSSSSYNSFKDSRCKIQQKNSNSECDGNYDSASDVSDEAESKYYGPETYCSSENKFNSPAVNTEISSDAFSAVKLNRRKNKVSQPELGKPKASEFENGDLKSASALISVNSFSTHHSENCNDNNLSSCRINSQMRSHDKNSHVNNNIRQCSCNTLEFNDVDLALHNDDSSVGDSLFDNIAGRDFISDYLAFSDSVVFGTDGSSRIVFDGEESICNFFMGIDSYMSSSNQNGICQKSPDDMEDVEVSSTASMSSVLCRVLNMDFDEQFDAGDSSIMKIEPSDFVEAHSQDKRLLMEDHAGDFAEFEAVSHSSTIKMEKSGYEMKLGNDFHSTCHDQGQSCSAESQMHEKNCISHLHPGDYKFRETEYPYSLDICEAGPEESAGHNEERTDKKEDATEDGGEQKILENFPENDLDERNGRGNGLEADKRRQMPLLKTFVGGTALVGVLFFFLQISRPSKQLNQKLRSAKSSRKEQNGRPNGAYPAEKLRFGN